MQTEVNKKNSYYPDVTIFLVLIPFISAFNYYLTYNNIRLNGFLLLTFTIDTLQGYFGWWGARSFIFYLDRRLPYEKNLARRILVQIAGTMAIGLFIISILTELVSLIARGRTVPLEFYKFDLFIISIWFLVVNGIYLGIYFYRCYRESETHRLRENEIKTEGLFVKQGKQDIRLDYHDLEGLFVDDDYAVACQSDGKKYYLTQSLDKIEKALPASLFFRLNRKYLIHRHIVTGYKRAEHGKILVQLKATSHLPVEIPVSRLRAPAFRTWFQPY